MISPYDVSGEQERGAVSTVNMVLVQCKTKKKEGGLRFGADHRPLLNWEG
jgi:hypothetical protein